MCEELWHLQVAGEASPEVRDMANRRGRGAAGTHIWEVVTFQMFPEATC